MVQTTLIPSVLSLSEFFIRNFPNVLWYPYWYLGVPYNYLIGPVVPVLYSLFLFLGLGENSYLFILFISFLIISTGVFFLAKSFGKENKQALFSSVLFLFMPTNYFLLSFQNGLSFVAFSLVPFTLILFKDILEGKRKNWILLSILISLILLINVSTILDIIVGFPVLYFVVKGRNIDGEIIARSILSLLFSVFLSTVWYTPGFWIVSMTNPSLGGIPLFNILVSILNFLFNFVPIILVIVFFRWRKYKPKDKFLIFASIFFFSYLFLSIVRFLANPIFAQDWISYSFELGFALSLMIPQILLSFRGRKFQVVSLFLALSLFFLSFVSISGLFKNSGTYESKISSWVSLVKENQRIFLSGSSVFWINSFRDVMQVRGGSDSSSLYKTWADGAYQIREGRDKELTSLWLKILGVSYVLTNNSESLEYYRDFKFMGKFSGFENVRQGGGDSLYFIKNSEIARVADKGLLNVPPYINGADLNSLSLYADSIQGPAYFKYIKPYVYTVNAVTARNQIISVAVTYSPDFKVVRGEGNIMPDSYGNTLIIPKKPGHQIFEVKFVPNILGYLLPMALSMITLILIVYYRQIFPKFKNRINLHIGFFEDEDY